jgi:hypothetical protein
MPVLVIDAIRMPRRSYFSGVWWSGQQHLNYDQDQLVDRRKNESRFVMPPKLGFKANHLQ